MPKVVADLYWERIFEQRNDRLVRSRFHSLCQGGILFRPLCGYDLGNHHLFPGADLAVGAVSYTHLDVA